MKNLRETLLDRNYEASVGLIDTDSLKKLHNPRLFHRVIRHIDKFNQTTLTNTYLDKIQDIMSEYLNALRVCVIEDLDKLVPPLQLNNFIDFRSYEPVKITKQESDCTLRECEDMIKFAVDLDGLLYKNLAGYSKIESSSADSGVLMKKLDYVYQEDQPRVIIKDAGSGFERLKKLNGKKAGKLTCKVIDANEITQKQIESLFPGGWTIGYNNANVDWVRENLPRLILLEFV